MSNLQRKLDHVLDEKNQHEMVALARALCPFAEQATDLQMLLCVALVEAKGDERLVADEAGVSNGTVKRECQSSLGLRIIKKLAKDKLQGVGYVKAISALIDVAESTSQTGTARNNASKVIIKLVQDEVERNPNNADGGDDLNNMSLSQLRKMVNSIKQDLVRIPSPQPIER